MGHAEQQQQQSAWSFTISNRQRLHNHITCPPCSDAPRQRRGLKAPGVAMQYTCNNTHDIHMPRLHCVSLEVTHHDSAAGGAPHNGIQRAVPQLAIGIFRERPHLQHALPPGLFPVGALQVAFESGVLRADSSCALRADSSCAHTGIITVHAQGPILADEEPPSRAAWRRCGCAPPGC